MKKSRINTVIFLCSIIAMILSVLVYGYAVLFGYRARFIIAVSFLTVSNFLFIIYQKTYETTKTARLALFITILALFGISSVLLSGVILSLSIILILFIIILSLGYGYAVRGMIVVPCVIEIAIFLYYIYYLTARTGWLFYGVVSCIFYLIIVFLPSIYGFSLLLFSYMHTPLVSTEKALVLHKKALDKGIITKEEYEEKRKQIIENL